jgi:hypothetical protein
MSGGHRKATVGKLSKWGMRHRLDWRAAWARYQQGDVTLAQLGALFGVSDMTMHRIFKGHSLDCSHKSAMNLKKARAAAKRKKRVAAGKWLPYASDPAASRPESVA